MFIRSWVVIILTTLSLSSLAQELPDWVFNAPATSHQLTAVGSGLSVREAKRTAIAEIIAQVSQAVSSQSVSVVEKQASQSTLSFKQSVSSQTLSIDINDATIDKEFIDETSGTVYVQVSVSKKQLVRFLEDELTPFRELLFPQNSSSVDKVLWSLKYKQSNEYGLRIERALAALGASKPSSKKRLLDNLGSIAEVWQRYGVRVIADSSLQSVTNAINQHIPSATETVLWLQLKPSHKTRQQQNLFQHKLDLSVELTQPRSPFQTYQQKYISVVGNGQSASEASQDARQQLRTILDTPIQSWLFEKGSNL